MDPGEAREAREERYEIEMWPNIAPELDTNFKKMQL